SSFLVSAGLHLAVLALFLFWKINLPSPPQEYVEIGFGMPGGSGGGGGEVEQMNQNTDLAASNQNQAIASDAMQNLDKDNSQITQPKTNEKDEEKVVTSPVKEKVAQNASDVKNQNAGASNIDRAKSPAGFGTNPLGSGIGNGKGSGKGNGNGEGDGNGDGYGIDWGGRGNRRIYSYQLPAYPDGVSKEIDVKLKFSIRPDGTVGTIIPLMKVDTRLENAAIRSLQTWRFEPMTSGNYEQWAIIVFPYRLQ
ncbi:MAG: energy transducer TonB, partial [Syntrophothermus sp.]